VEAQVEALLATVDEDPCLISDSVNSEMKLEFLKLAMANGFDGSLNECLRYIPRIYVVNVTYLFNHCLRLGHFPAAWKEAKCITAEARQRLNIFPKLRSEQLLIHYGQII
jgi:hypothetical protein